METITQAVMLKEEAPRSNVAAVYFTIGFLVCSLLRS